MQITLGQSLAGAAARFHHRAALSVCWEAAVILRIDQAAGEDSTVTSAFRREVKRGAASEVRLDSSDMNSKSEGIILLI